MTPSLDQLVPRRRRPSERSAATPRIAATRCAPDGSRRTDVWRGHAYTLPVVRELRLPAAGPVDDRTW